jgi:hypothetical protein
MSRKISQAFAGVLVAIGVSACEMTKSEHALGPTVAGPIPGVNITSPTPLEPAQGLRIAVGEQPISLTLSNAATTGVRPLNYVFEVATDAGFANKVFSLEGVTPGASGRTAVRLPNALAPERSYYWRARAQDGANTGPFSAAAFFNVFTPVVLGRPILQEPIANTTATSPQPTLKFANAPRSGPAGPIIYEIHLAENDAFSPATGIWSIDERPGQTILAVPVLLSANKQYFWRVRAYESSTVGPWSDTQAFKVPTAGGGGGVGGGGGNGTSGHIPAGPATAARAEQVVLGTGREFPNVTAQGASDSAAEHLMLRMIWHLRLAGFQAGRQKNPSGAISGDKLSVFADGYWRSYDVVSTRHDGSPLDVHFDEVFPANYVPDTGIPD